MWNVLNTLQKVTHRQVLPWVPQRGIDVIWQVWVGLHIGGIQLAETLNADAGAVISNHI